MYDYPRKLRNIIAMANISLDKISDADFEYKPNSTTWSKKEILGHLIDSAYNNHQRFIRAEGQGNLIFQGYDQVDWVIKNNYQNRSTDELIHTWVTANLHLCCLVETLSATTLQEETIDHNFHEIGMVRPPEGAPSSLEYLFWDYIFHVEHHLAQIIDGYEKTNYEYSPSKIQNN